MAETPTLPKNREGSGTRPKKPLQKPNQNPDCSTNIDGGIIRQN
jgi:hypothetical protein